MRPLLALTVAGVLVCAGGAVGNAEPASGAQPDETGGVRSAAFLESLRAAGITYSSPGQAIDAARALCGLVDRGEPALQVISDLKSHNPGFSTDDAAQFAAIAADAYCPHQLARK